MFAASGLIGHDFVPGENGVAWDGYIAAKRIATTVRPDDTGTSTFASEWGWWMRERLNEELAKNPAQLLSHLHSALLANGFFVGRAVNGDLEVYSATVNCECSTDAKTAALSVDKHPPSFDGLPVAIAGPREAVASFDELLDASSPRARAERATWSALPKDDSIAHDAGVTIRSLEFVIKYSGAPTVGGAVDAVTMDRSGKIEWIQRKEQCRDDN